LGLQPNFGPFSPDESWPGSRFRITWGFQMSDTVSANCSLAVIKLGGSILKSLRAYRRAARFVRNRYNAAPNERLVIVVSAQEGHTDRLAATAGRIVAQPASAALDLLWSTGELRSVALLALELQALGVSAAAVNIHETGLASRRCSDSAASGRQVHLNPRRLFALLATHPVAVVPGFFATDSSGAVVSLGRGGSDLTAVLLAQGLAASRCELVKDVPGYFTNDPHRDPSARHIPALTFEQALAFAHEGCDLVQRQAIEAAARCNLPLVIRCLDEGAPLSWVTDAGMESACDVSALAESPVA
jgi:aspartate kinase